MPRVIFAPSFRRHVDCPPLDATGSTIAALLESIFTDRPALRGYVLDDQGRLRKHVNVFINGEPIIDRMALTDPAPETGEVYVIQALSGG